MAEEGLLGGGASEVGVAPRLRSLKVAEEGGARTPGNRTPVGTPPLSPRGGTSDGSSSPLLGGSPLETTRLRAAWLRNGFSAKRGRGGTVAMVCGGLGLLALAFVAGSFVQGWTWKAGASGGSSVSSVKTLGGSAMASTTEIGTTHLRVYVAELPTKYNSDLLQATMGLGQGGSLMSGASEEAEKKRQMQSAMVSDLLANPFGRPIDDHDPEGLRMTAYNSLDFMYHMQMLHSPLRVHNESEADIVFVPFYVQKLAKLDKELEKPNRYALALVEFWNEVNWRLPSLGLKPHIIPIPAQEIELRGNCGGHGIDFLCHPKSANFTILTPERYTGPVDDYIPSKISAGMVGVDAWEPTNAVPVPYVGHIHYSQGSKSKVEGFDAKAVEAKKVAMVSEAFRPRVPIRRELKNQCAAQLEECLHFDAVIEAQSSVPAIVTVHQNHLASWFCLQPPGETSLRVGLYDCMLSDSIPVVFDRNITAVLPFTDVIDWSLFLTQVDAANVTLAHQSIIDLLKAEHEVEDRLAKLSALRAVRHLFQYSITPIHLLVAFDKLEEVSLHDDAFTMSLKATLRHLCRQGWLPDRCPASLGPGVGNTARSTRKHVRIRRILRS